MYRFSAMEKNMAQPPGSDRITLSSAFQLIADELRHTAPKELLEKYSGLAGTVICGFLFRQGMADPRAIEMASGTCIDGSLQRINKVLSDPLASAWYFAALDAIGNDFLATAFRPRTTTTTR